MKIRYCPRPSFDLWPVDSTRYLLPTVVMRGFIPLSPAGRIIIRVAFWTWRWTWEFIGEEEL